MRRFEVYHVSAPTPPRHHRNQLRWIHDVATEFCSDERPRSAHVFGRRNCARNPDSLPRKHGERGRHSGGCVTMNKSEQVQDLRQAISTLSRQLADCVATLDCVESNTSAGQPMWGSLPTEKAAYEALEGLVRMGLSPTKCASQLNSLGFSTRSGRPWTRINIRRMYRRQQEAMA